MPYQQSQALSLLLTFVAQRISHPHKTDPFVRFVVKDVPSSPLSDSSVYSVVHSVSFSQIREIRAIRGKRRSI
ncbi:hypothetical protein SAMN02745181_3442 [Rubritalea squalenifaciens DSM 18772]|uniref:Uncharacterized protein n=1 Tax=Rubritalea squalenifaciens DSM 18772 TaxID=1123071 RepID=A0A1M6QM47_9BACT|nr:hypothetical protein SAMN02745181_3442 [Rubritalea squalenifaciens DSM 18772]